MTIQQANAKPSEHLAKVQGKARGGRGLARAQEVLDVVVKLMAPVAVIGGAWLGHQYQQTMQASQLLTQREQSDTQIRAEMFKAITEKLVGTNGKEAPQPAERAVFAELLALNFHEHIELRPLMVKVDKDLLEQTQQPGRTPEQMQATVDQRYELRSAAKRVRDRQIAMLVEEGHPDRQLTLGEQVGAWVTKLVPGARAAQAGDSSQRGRLRHVGIRFFTGPMLGKDSAAPTECDVPPEAGGNVHANEPYIDASPDGLDSIAIIATRAKWDTEEFTLRVKTMGSPSAALKPDRAPVADDAASPRVAPYGAEGITFEVNDFDFPLTDNTLLASGARYSIFVDKVCPAAKPGDAAAIKLGLLWFPSDYYPARERPTNRRQLAEYLGLNMRPAR
jgi:hypothetical protein